MATRCRMLIAAVALTMGVTAVFMVPRALKVSALPVPDHSYVAATLYTGQPQVFSYLPSTKSLQHGWWTGTKWQFEILDGVGCIYAGCFNADDVGGVEFTVNGNSAISYNGQLHVFALDMTTHDMVHDWWDGSHWHFQQLDGPGSSVSGHNPTNTGYFTTAAVYGGQLHVFTQIQSTPNPSLGHDWWDGSKWHFENLDGQGSPYPEHTGDAVGFNPVPLLFGTQLQVFYGDFTKATFHQAWWDGAHWNFRCLDGNESGCLLDTGGPDAVGPISTNAALLYSGQPHVFYYDGNGTSVIHAWWNGVQWHSEFLDGAKSTYPGANPDNVGFFNAALVYGGQLHLWTSDFHSADSGYNLEHDWWNGSAWSFQRLAGTDKPTTASGTDKVGYYNAAVIYAGAPHVWSQDQTNGKLFHGWWNGSAWAFEEF